MNTNKNEGSVMIVTPLKSDLFVSIRVHSWSRLRSLIVYTVVGALLAFASAPSRACTACFGQSDSALARGMNMGIFALLLVITSVLCGVAGFFVYVARRTAHLEEASRRLPNNLSQH